MLNIHRNHKAYQGWGEGGKGVWRGRLYTTRMTSALRWAAMRAILMFHNCEGQNHKTVSTDYNFWSERRAKADSNRGPSAYQPTALPLSRTGSRTGFWKITRILNWYKVTWVFILFIFSSECEVFVFSMPFYSLDKTRSCERKWKETDVFELSQLVPEPKEETIRWQDGSTDHICTQNFELSFCSQLSCYRKLDSFSQPLKEP